jgi:hypothetical protein
MRQNTRKGRKVDAVASKLLDDLYYLRGLRNWKEHTAWMDYWERLIWRFIRREDARSREVIELDEDTRLAIDSALCADSFGGYRTKARDSYGYRREFILMAIQAACEAVTETRNIRRMTAEDHPFQEYRLGLVKKSREQIEAENFMVDSQARRETPYRNFLKVYQQMIEEPENKGE